MLQPQQHGNADKLGNKPASDYILNEVSKQIVEGTKTVSGKTVNAKATFRKQGKVIYVKLDITIPAGGAVGTLNNIIQIPEAYRPVESIAMYTYISSESPSISALILNDGNLNCISRATGETGGTINLYATYIVD